MARAILRNLDSMIQARGRYAHHGPCDSRLWRPRLVADTPDRKANIESVPGARYIELHDTRHFTALEAPHEVERILRNVAP